MLIIGALIVALALCALYWLPRITARPHPGIVLPLQGQNFPPGFLWGTGEDAYQHEGGNDRADWYAWERSEPRPFADGSVAGRCVDFWNRYEEDFARAAADGQNFHRIGIEWSRVEPAPGSYDESAFEQYRQMLLSLRAKGMRVAVNLWHFTLPAWAARAGAWENPETMRRWEAYVAECGRRFGGMVDYWSTMIDAQIYVLRGYFTAELPPQKRDQSLGLRVLSTLATAHGRAYRILKPYGGRVGMIYFFSLCRSAGNLLDDFVTTQFDRLFNWDLLDALYNGLLHVAVTGVPGLDAALPEAKGTLDWLGINYYYREVIRFNPKAQGLVQRSPAPGSTLTDMGWEIYPQGIYELCKRVAKRYHGVEMIITENGIADADDRQRPRFILDHLAWVRRLLDEGCPLSGYSYWAGTDNLEWLDGFVPKFGLYRVNLQTMERHETASARLYRFIATNNRLPFESEVAGILDQSPSNS